MNGKFPILVYHQIVPDFFSIQSFPIGDRPYYIKISDFCSHLNYLTINNFITSTIQDVGLFNKQCNNSNKIVITFDDGQISDYTVAFPAMIERKIKATFYVITDFVGKKGYLSWSQLSEMQKYGMEIGSHSCSHRCLLDLTKDQTEEELIKSKRVLEDHLGCRVFSFSIPFGFGEQHIINLAFESGYRTVCTSDLKLNRYNIKYPAVYGRIGIRRNDNIRMFKGIVDMEWQTIAKLLTEDRIKSALKRVLGRDLWYKFRYKMLSQLKRS